MLPASFSEVIHIRQTLTGATQRPMLACRMRTLIIVAIHMPTRIRTWDSMVVTGAAMVIGMAPTIVVIRTDMASGIGAELDTTLDTATALDTDFVRGMEREVDSDTERAMEHARDLEPVADSAGARRSLAAPFRRKET